MCWLSIPGHFQVILGISSLLVDLLQTAGFPPPHLALYVFMFYVLRSWLLCYIVFSALALWAQVYCRQVPRSYQVASQNHSGQAHSLQYTSVSYLVL